LKAAVAGLACLLVMPVVFIGAAVGALGSAGGPNPTALGAIPAGYLALYQAAAAESCPGLSWTVLAAIGTVESDNGQSSLPGVRAGANPAGAEGPMQMLASTFAAYAQPVPPGGAQPPSPYDPTDAVYAAARDLCVNGAADPARLAGAVFAYNHDPAYVTQVLDLASAYAGVDDQGAADQAPDGPAAAAVAFALGQLGAPYRWGGDGPGGFDCSGLTRAAYRAAGITLPRSAQAQFNAGPPFGPDRPIQAGDLVFFGAGASAVSHVGLVVGRAANRSWQMVDAPHAGAAVRVEVFTATPGAAWGAEGYLGATRPWVAVPAAPAPSSP
jgi:cell wall-associated NlpC family hydrolase